MQRRLRPKIKTLPALVQIFVVELWVFLKKMTDFITKLFVMNVWYLYNHLCCLIYLSKRIYSLCFALLFGVQMFCLRKRTRLFELFTIL